MKNILIIFITFVVSCTDSNTPKVVIQKDDSISTLTVPKNKVIEGDQENKTSHYNALAEVFPNIKFLTTSSCSAELNELLIQKIMKIKSNFNLFAKELNIDSFECSENWDYDAQSQKLFYRLSHFADIEYTMQYFKGLYLLKRGMELDTFIYQTEASLENFEQIKEQIDYIEESWLTFKQTTSHLPIIEGLIVVELDLISKASDFYFEKLYLYEEKITAQENELAQKIKADDVKIELKIGKQLAISTVCSNQNIELATQMISHIQDIYIGLNLESYRIIFTKTDMNIPRSFVINCTSQESIRRSLLQFFDQFDLKKGLSYYINSALEFLSF